MQCKTEKTTNMKQISIYRTVKGETTLIGDFTIEEERIYMTALEKALEDICGVDSTLVLIKGCFSLQVYDLVSHKYTLTYQSELITR